jgi:UDP-2,3-diacylglucosamine pyrophosphatase LpxH
MPPKFKVVLSDLHLGAGFAAQGNRLEDFDRDRELAAFLASLAAESEREGADVELILNGDTFEMLQVPHVRAFEPARAYAAALYHSTREMDSSLKMAHIVAGHPAVFEALRRFARLGPPSRSITFVKGNHDVDLHWPTVQDRIREALDCHGARELLLGFEARCVCREGIYVEHGNQYAETLSRLPDMETPLDPERPRELALPPGSWFVMDVFNQVERERYWIDGVKPITALVWYALAFDFGFAARALVTLIRALPGMIDAGLLAAGSPEADLLRQLQDPVRVDEIAARYKGDEAFRTWFDAEAGRVLHPPGEEAALGAMRAGEDAGAVARGDQVRAMVGGALYEAASRRAAETGARLVCFGHTHAPVVEPLPDGGRYINSGTWTWSADLTGAGKSTWEELFRHPERFADDHRLSYVRIEYDEAGAPAGQLLAWEAGEGGLGPESVSLWGRLRAWWRDLWARLRALWP